MSAANGIDALDGADPRDQELVHDVVRLVGAKGAARRAKLLEIKQKLDRAPDDASASESGTGPDVPRFASAIVAPETWPEDEPPIRFLVPALSIAVGRATLFNGPAGIGKTLVAMGIASLLLGGLAGLDGIVTAREPCRVLHADADQGVIATRRRYRRLLAGLDVRARPTLVGLALAVAEGFDLTSVRDWQRLLAGFDLAIVDSLSALVALAGLDENVSQDVRRIMGALLAASESTSCAVVLISHTGHDDKDGQKKRPRGSSAIIQGAGAIWTFTGEPARGSVRTVTLERESENDNGDEPLKSWRYTIGVSRVWTSGMVDADGRPVPALVVERAAGDVEDAEAEKQAQAAAKILDCLAREHGHTNRDGLLAAAKTGSRLEFARAVLGGLLGRGVVVKHEGAFRLASEVR